MGLLDDAIREHLELKRKAGDDPAEVARLEREALSPPVREPVGAEPEIGALGDQDGHAEPAGGDFDPHAAPTEFHPIVPVEPAAAAEPPPSRPPARRPPAPTPPLPDPSQPTIAYDVDELLDADDETAPRPRPGPPTEPHEAARPTRPAPRPPERDPTDEIFADEPEPEAKPEPDEDVLEETPEFLQETPEHDRLWFEQKPPRDFDFDK